MCATLEAKLSTLTLNFFLLALVFLLAFSQIKLNWQMKFHKPDITFVKSKLAKDAVIRSEAQGI